MEDIQRNIDILKFRITETENKIENFIRFEISDKKIEKLEVVLEKYKSQLAHYESLL